MTTIALLPGDGIGTEILDGPVAYLRRLAGRRRACHAHWSLALRNRRDGSRPGPRCRTRPSRRATRPTSCCPAQWAPTPVSPPSSAPTPKPRSSRCVTSSTCGSASARSECRGGDDVVIVRNITGGAYAGPDQRVESDGVRPAEDHIALDPVRVQEVFDIAVGYARVHPGAGPSVSTRQASTRRPDSGGASPSDRRGDRGPVRRRQRRPSRLRARQIRRTALGHRHRGPVRRHPVRHRVREGRITRAVRFRDDQSRPAVRARHHRAVRACTRLVPAPHRHPSLQPDRRLARPRGPARLVSRPRRARPARHGPRALDRAIEEHAADLRPRRARTSQTSTSTSSTSACSTLLRPT